MSGICGILRFDGGPHDSIAAMARQLKNHGPEATRLFQEGPCALGHTLLATTPEAVIEQLPLTHAGSGCTITADLRLDNRRELLQLLGLANEDRVIGDGEIVLNAYLKWGEESPARLLGDFAFAIWDPRSRSIFCARDQIGMKQLIHAFVPGKVFACASAPSAVVLAQGAPRRINEGRIADFLEDYLETIDFTSTFFEDVHRLPPAHRLTVDARGRRIDRYWTLEPRPVLRLGSDAAYEEAFLEVFTQSVRYRLRAPSGTVGSMLSGGMDSGSTVAVAARIFADERRGRFPTFSAIGPDPLACVETRTILSAITMPNLAPVLIDWGALDDWRDDLMRLKAESEEPFDWWQDLIRATYLAAGRAGIKVMLDGVGGDTVFAPGTLNARLLMQGKLRQLWREAKGEEAFWSDAGWKARNALVLAARQALVPFWIRQARQALRSRLRRIPQDSLASAALASRVKLIDRINTWDDRHRWRWGPYEVERARSIVALELVIGRERYDRVAAAASVEPRDAFLDRHVVEFCLSLPMEQLQRNGWPKHLLRRAMKGRMPDEVRWRKGKEHIGFWFSSKVADDRKTRDSEHAENTQYKSTARDWMRWGDDGLERHHLLSHRKLCACYALEDWCTRRPMQVVVITDTE